MKNARAKKWPSIKLWKCDFDSNKAHKSFGKWKTICFCYHLKLQKVLRKWFSFSVGNSPPDEEIEAVVELISNA